MYSESYSTNFWMTREWDFVEHKIDIRLEYIDAGI
jgi:hypothetical protein